MVKVGYTYLTEKKKKVVVLEEKAGVYHAVTPALGVQILLFGDDGKPFMNNHHAKRVGGLVLDSASLFTGDNTHDG